MKAFFKLCTFASNGGSQVGLILKGEDAEVYDLALLQDLTGESRLPNSIRTMLDNWDASFAQLAKLSARLADGWPDAKQAIVSREGLKLLAPIQPPGLIFQAAANYRSHVWQIECSLRRKQGMSAEEASTPELRRAFDEATDARVEAHPPYIFTGVSHAISGPYDDIVLPSRYGLRPDWEVELGAIFGKEARYIERERALECVAGYVICNDISHRGELEKPNGPLGADWLAMKNSPGFFPTGPWFVPAAFIENPMDLRIQFRLNGETYQDESTSGMIYDIHRLISHLTFVTVVKPGDMLITGSPSGNGLHVGRFLQPGDVIEAEIDGLGVQRNHVVAE